MDDSDHDVAAARVPQAGEPVVTTSSTGDLVTVGVAGELTEAARRPLVRVVTDLLLADGAPRRVDLDLRDVSFMNSAGMAVLVQLQRMTDPRGIEVGLVAPPAAVTRPLQMAGLWRRFTIREE